MAKFKRYTVNDGGYHGELGFHCPGCGHRHFINDSLTALINVPVWGFNGDYEKPTITPSILVRNYRYNSDTGNYNIEVDRCHSFIRDGKIEFLTDCQHSLAGQTVELPEIE